MSTLVLNQHNDVQRLGQQLQHFERRLSALDTKTQRHLLLSMLAELETRNRGGSTANHYLVYWPLNKNYVKRCLCEYQTQDFSLVSVTTLAQRLYRETEDDTLSSASEHLQLADCECQNHSRKAQPQWQEFVYPQFVRQLCETLSLVSGSGGVKRALQNDDAPEAKRPRQYNLSKRCSADAYHYHFSFDVSLGTTVSTEHVATAFDDTCTPFVVPPHLPWMHRALQLTPNLYKARFKTASSVCVRAQHIQRGSVKLGDTPLRDGEPLPYTLFVSNCWLEVPRKENRHGHYKRYQLETSDERNVTLHTGNQSNRVEVNAAGCLIRSDARLIVHFKQDAQLLLMTEGRCQFQLQHALLDLWCDEQANCCNTPYRYKVDHDAVQEAQWFSRFINAPVTPEAVLQQQEAARSVCDAYQQLFSEGDAALPDITLSKDGQCCRFLANYAQTHQYSVFSQHDSYRDRYYDDGALGQTMDAVARIGVYFRKPSDDVPEFYTEHGVRLSYCSEEFVGTDGQLYRVRLLYHHRAPHRYLASFDLSHRHRLLLLVPFMLHRAGGGDT
jgi:hypothetical protein